MILVCYNPYMDRIEEWYLVPQIILNLPWQVEWAEGRVLREDYCYDNPEDAGRIVLGEL